MTEKAENIAYNPAAPAPERYDAGVELAERYRPSNQLFPSGDMQKALEYFSDGLAEREVFMKAAWQKDALNTRDKAAKSEGMKSVYLDDMQIFASGDYYEKPTPMGFDAMRAMVEQTPILNAIIGTRIRQVALFTQISEDGGRGFEIRHQDKRQKLSGAQLQQSKDLAKFMLNCGFESNPRKRKILKRDNLTQFMAKSVRDSLTMDSAPIETEFKRNRDNGIDGFYAVDGETIRLCTEAGYDGDDAIFAVQVLEGQMRTTYTHDELIYEVRNPRTNVDVVGYGYAETELLVRTVTGFLNAMTYNIKGFDSNSIPKGILSLIGDYGTEDLAAFKRMWNATMRGVENRWSMPVMTAKDPASKATFQPIDVEFNEMHFAKWISFLVAIACGIYAIDPSEINFESFAAGTSTMSGDDTKEKLANSKDKGFKPLMAYYESMFSDFIIADFSEDLCFRWVGMDDQNEELVDKKDVAALTWGEYRAKLGYDSVKGDEDMDGAPMNPSLLSAWQAMRQMKQQNEMADKQMQAQQAAGAGGDDEPDFGDDGPDDGGAQPADGSMPAGARPADGSMPAGAGGEAPPDSTPEKEPGNEFGQSPAADSEEFGKALMIYDFGVV